MEINEAIGLTQNNCLEILQYVNKDQQYDKQSLSFAIKPLSDAILGYGAQHFILNITYKTRTKSEVKSQRFFLKNLNATVEVIVYMAKSLNSYEKEAFFYNGFLKECKAMGIDISFAPEGYYARPYFLVMEDISQSGFRIGHKHRPMHMGQCRSVFDALAKFHMSVAIYEYEKKKINTSYSLANERKDTLLDRVDKEGNMNAVERWLQASLDGLLATIDILPSEDIAAGIDKDVFKNKLKCYSEKMFSDLTPKEGDLCCLLHNDLWCYNIMFRYPATDDDSVNTLIGDGSTDTGADPIDCKLIDFQLLTYGNPASDVMRVIHANTRRDIRDKHKDELLRHYFNRTIDCLRKYGINPDSFSTWTWDNFLSNCARFEIAIKVRCIAARAMTFLPNDINMKWMQEPGGTDRLLFSERDISMQEAFTAQTGDLYRMIIREDIHELWSMLKNAEKQSL